MRLILPILLVIFSAACVDRIDFDTGGSAYYPVVIDGHISNRPGPYTVQVSKAFDIESKLSFKTNVNVKSITLSDNYGTSEKLVGIKQVYQTDPNGIRGIVGRIYQLKVELLDGRVYESNPDTLLPPGKVDSIYYQYKEETINQDELKYGFDVFFNSSTGDKKDFHFIWEFTGTYRVDTNPELYDTICAVNADTEGRCPKPLPCSGYVVSRTSTNGIVQVGPCECCTCWVNFFNENPIISNNQVVQGGNLRTIKAGYVPINQWTFKYKVHAEVTQMSLSRQSFAFWKAVSEQKQATNSLFLPIAGKIPSNFKQVSGPIAPIEGIFYSTSVSQKSVFINKKDVPNQGTIPLQQFPLTNSCLKLFRYASTSRPSFWTDD